MTLGGIGLASLLASEGLLAATPQGPVRPKIDPDKPYAPRPAHFAMPAKQVLVIYLPGAVSHVDTFDYKPELARFHGQKPPGVPAVTFEGPTGNIAKPFWEFKPRGKSGKMVSALLPNLASAQVGMNWLPPPMADLGLTPEQLDKIKPVVLEQRKQSKAVREDAALDAAAKQEKMKPINKTANDQFKAIMTPEQWTKFQEARKALAEKNKVVAPAEKKPYSGFQMGAPAPSQADPR